MAWIDDFEKKLNALVASHAALTQNDPQSLAQGYLQGLNKLYSAEGPYKGGPAPKSGPSVMHGLKDILKGSGSAALWAIDKAERPLYGIENVGRGIYGRGGHDLLDTHAHGSVGSNIEHTAKDFWAGFSGKQKTTGSDVLRAGGVKGRKAAAIGGLGLDLAVDPLSYAGGPVAKAGVEFLKGLKGAKTAVKVADAVDKEGEIDSVAKSLSTGPRAITGPAPVRALTGPPANVINGRALLKTYDAAIKKVGVKRFAKGTKIAPNWNDVTEEVAKEVTPPVAKTATKSTARQLSKEQSDNLAALQHLLSNPDTARIPITLRGQEKTTTVNELRQLVKADPSKADIVKSIIKNHVAKLAASGEDLPVKYATKSGPILGDGPSIGTKAFSRLLQTGKVPATAGSSGKLDDILAQYAVHSQEDLPVLHVHSLSGETTPLKDYLDKLGVKVSPVKSNAERLTAALTGEAPVGKSPFKFDFEDAAPATETVTKRVALSKAERAAWIKAHDFLSPDEQKSLLASRSAKEFHRKADEILADTKTSKAKDLEDLATAVSEGRVDPKELETLQKLTGGKHFAGVKQRYEKTVAALAKAEHAMFNPSTNAAETFSREEVGKSLADSVTPADQIVEDVSTKGTSPVLDSSPEALDSSQQQLLQESLIHGVAKNFIDPNDPALYPFKTARGVPRTAAVFGKGTANHPESWNKFAQYDAMKELVNPSINNTIDQLMKQAEANGVRLPKATRAFAQGSIKYDYIMPILKAQEKFLRAHGVPPVLGDGNTGPALSILDVLTSLPKNFVISTMFDATPKARSIFYTQFSDIAERIIAHGMGQITEPELREVIGDVIKNPLHSIGRTGKQPLYSGLAKSLFGMRKSNPQGAADLLNQVTDTFMDAAPEIMQKYAANQAQYAMQFGAAVPKVSNEVMVKLSKMFIDPNFSPGDLVKMSTGVDKLAQATAKQLGVTDPATIDAITKASQLKAAQILPPRMMAEQKAAEKFTAAGKDTNKIAAVGSEQAKGDTAVSTALLDPPGNPADYDDAFEMTDKDRLAGANAVTRGLTGFFPHIGNEDLRPLLNEADGYTRYVATRASGFFNSLSKKYTEEQLMSAWMHMQRGTIPEDAFTLPAYNEFKPVVDTIFDPSPSNFFTRNGVTAEQIQQKMDRYKIPFKYTLGDLNDWKAWQVEKDPIQLVSKYYAAAQASLSERLIANNIMANPEWASKVAKPGFIRIKGKGILPTLLDTSMYYADDVASQFNTLNRAMEEAVAKKSSGTFVKVYDGVLHSLKSGFTIYRPGHHMRNMVSDGFFSWIAGVNNPKYYYDALKVMHHIKGDTREFSALHALQSGGIDTVDPTKAVTKVRVGGKTVGLTPDAVFRLAARHGIITDYTTVEDITDTGVSAKLARVSPFRGKLHTAAAHTSEYREYLARLPHFMHELEHGSYKSLDEAAQKAGNVVRKWHPDGSDLGRTEQKYARRVILFYSWMRKAIPLVIESAVYHPGKTLVYPKAYYAIAQANGINLNGFGDPYPADKIFPDWISNNITGPIAGSASSQYYGVSPGIPTNDIADQFGTNPKSALLQVLGSTNPAVRVPVEAGLLPLVTGKGYQLGTGAEIHDKTDYADSQIPIASLLASLTNRSPTSGFIQPVRSVATGNEAPGFDNKALLNMLSGLGLSNLSRYAKNP